MVNLDRIKNEIFLSIDGEFTGDIPPVSSMIQLGAQPFSLAKGFIGDGYCLNMNDLPDSIMLPQTQIFWDENPEAWESTRENRLDPEVAMHFLVKWLHDEFGYREQFNYRGTFETRFDRPITLAAYPSIDLVWFHWYIHYFLEHNPFGWSGFDFKSANAMMLKQAFRDSTKRNMPNRWFVTREDRMPHNALSDAKDQAIMMAHAMCEYYEISVPKNMRG